jgi:MFS transporter, DHA2 family, multidrug resistance protein
VRGLLDDAKAAFVTGLHAAAISAGIVHAALGILASSWIPRAGSDPDDAGTAAVREVT